MFWTTAYLAFAAHLFTGVLGIFGGQTGLIFHDLVNPPRVTNPYGDSLLTVWWTLDIVLAWLVWLRPKWVQIERGLLHLLVFLEALGSSIVLSSNGYVRVLGVLLLIGALLAAAYRVVVYKFDPESLSGRLYAWTFQLVNLVLPWYKFPTSIAIFNLGALRVVLREKNLHNTSDIPVSNPAGLEEIPPFEARYLTERNMDGFYNDLDKPWMGCSSAPREGDDDSMGFVKSSPGARFGRNVPLDQAHPDPEPMLLTPSPRVVSQELLARRKFIPAPTLNMLAAAWIQFETHDWFNHGDPLPDKTISIPLADDDPWVKSHGCPIRIRRTRPDPTRDYAKEPRDANGRLRYPPTYVNAESHWWDASQIYGSNNETTAKLRTQYEEQDGKLVSTGKFVPGGKLYLDRDNLSLDPVHPIHPIALAGFSQNWWAGLSLLHTLFTREHNAICDRLQQEYADWDDDQVFNTARMVNAALLAKIHTVEWTPAILAHPALEVGMNANWWGLETERIYKSMGRISENEAFGGIPNSGVDHNGADYCLTEEFVSVYRMHTLLPDDLAVRSANTGQVERIFKMGEGVVGDLGDIRVIGEGRTMADVFYSFGVANPGAITIHNYPNFMRELKRDDGEVLDMASVDVTRDRERGVPRYNRFRQLLHKKPIDSFEVFRNEALHPGLPEELRRVYGQTNGKDNVDLLDLIVGLYSETPLPAGFGFSDTAFRIFILMASRRLKSDRFIARSFNSGVYTQVGIDWVQNNTMISVLLRHFPELAASMHGTTNAFKPWNDVRDIRSKDAKAWNEINKKWKTTGTRS